MKKILAILCMALFFVSHAWAVDVVNINYSDQATFTAGEALSTGDVVYIKAADGYAYKADTDLAIAAYGIVNAGSGGSVSSGALVNVARRGTIIGESGLTVNGAVFLTATAGTYDQTGVAAYKQPIGIARSATTIDFDIDAFYTPAGYATTGTFSSNVTVGGTLGVTGASTISNSLSVSNAVTMDSTIDVAGAATFASAPTIDTGIYSASTLNRLPGDQYEYVNEFNDVTDFDTTNGWVLTTTEAGAGDATEVIQDALFGVLKFTNDAADDDLDSAQSKYEIVALSASKQTVFSTRFKLGDATQSDAILGLCVRDTTPLASTDYIYFVKDDGDTNWDFVTAASSSETEVATVDTADTSWHVFSIVCNGTTSCTPYIDGVAGTASSSNIPTTEMAVTVHIQNGEAVAKTLELDYIYLMQER